MAKEKASKKLPKRTSRPRHKAYRASCWARQKVKKAERRAAQAEREAENKRRGQTGWEIANHNRRVKREIRRRAEAAAARFN